MNYLIFDVIIALILLFALWRGYSRGFILTLCGFLAIFVAFIGATVISDNLAKPVADAIRPAIERQIQGALEQSLQVEDSLASTGGEAPGTGGAAHLRGAGSASGVRALPRPGTGLPGGRGQRSGSGDHQRG